eukprot:4029780-Amphidinium_carterae.1
MPLKPKGDISSRHCHGDPLQNLAKFLGRKVGRVPHDNEVCLGTYSNFVSGFGFGFLHIVLDSVIDDTLDQKMWISTIVKSSGKNFGTFNPFSKNGVSVEIPGGLRFGNAFEDEHRMSRGERDEGIQ